MDEWTVSQKFRCNALVGLIGWSVDVWGEGVLV
jgi:hypothetical protein